MRNSDGYFELASAIMVTALKDYRKVVSELKKSPKSTFLLHEKKSLEDFFKGDLFNLIADFNEDLRMVVRKEGIEI